MGNFFDKISSDEIAEFRETFEEFMHSDMPSPDPNRTILHETEKSLLDLLLEPDSSNDTQFSFKILELIERIGELDVLDLPRHHAASSDLLALATKHRKDILENLESKNFDESRKNLWRNRINDFFDRFTLEIVKRWEIIENDRHKKEIDELEKSKINLSRENSYLRRIYSLSLQIASISSPDKTYEYFARKLGLILDLDFIVILDTSDKKPIEYIFHSDRASIKDLDVGRRKTEDVYELFKREAIDRDNIDVVIENPSILRARHSPKNDPESVIVPMIDDENTWGMIGVFRKEGNAFSPQEVQAISIVTSLVELVARNQRTLVRERALSRSLDEQINFARKIQERMLPKDYADNDFKITTRFKPSTILSGDFFHFFKTDLNERGVIIGDVTGHDVAAAMMMMTVMGILNDVFILAETTFEEMIHRANSRLNKTISEQFFVTAMAVWFDISGRLKYINMGHPTGLLSGKNTNPIQELNPTGFPLGIFEEVDLNPQEIDFKPGDRILLYTDGLTEAKDYSGKSFGLEKLKKIFSEASDLDTESTLDVIIKTVNDCVGSSGIHDDIAIAIIDCL